MRLARGIDFIAIVAGTYHLNAFALSNSIKYNRATAREIKAKEARYKIWRGTKKSAIR